MLVFAIESSCDETSVCIMKKDKTILSHIVYSQEIHKKHGGVVPELASRAHLEILQNITKKAFEDAGISHIYPEEAQLKLVVKKLVELEVKDQEGIHI